MDGVFCYHVVVMLFATVSLLFLWVGFATPGWFVVTFQEDLAAQEYTVSSLNRSLYYDVHCPQELKTCEPCEGGQNPNECIDTVYNSTNYNYHYTWVEGLISDKENWTAWRVIMTIVVFFAITGWILVLVLVCCLLKPRVYRIVATTAFFCWLLAAILIWIPVGMVSDMHLDVDDAINDDVPHDATLHVPYSIVVAAIGGFLALITAILLIYLIGICCNNDRSTGSPSETEVFTEPSKRTPTTVVQDGMYYGPYPFYNPETQVVYRDMTPVTYQYPTPALMHAYQYPGSSMEDEALTDRPRYKGEERWYDNRAYNNNVTSIPRL